MKIALAADHGGFDMKELLIARLRQAGHEVSDFGAPRPIPTTTIRTMLFPSPAPWRPAKSTAGSSSAAVGSGRPWPPTRSTGSGPVCATIIIPSARGSKTTT